MSRSPLQQRLIEIVEPVCQAAGYELVELRYVLEQGGWTLRVAVDLPLDEHTDPNEIPSDRVDLEDCENLSRELSAVLDVEDPIPQAFHLEVSSPGIDRPLRTAAHFRHFTGSEVKIQLAQPLQTPSIDRRSPIAGGGDPDGFAGGAGVLPRGIARRNFKGILQGVEDGDGEVVIACDGTVFRLPIDGIEHAKLVPDWDAVMKGGSGVGNRDRRIGPPSGPSGKPVKPGHRAQKLGQTSQSGHASSPPRGQPDGRPHLANAPATTGVDNKEQG